MIRRTRIKIISVIVLIAIIPLVANILMYQLGVGIYVGFGCGDSMEPNYNAGDVILYNSYDDINEGDVVRFTEDGENIFHRVIEVNQSRENPYKLKGDNNDFADGWYNKSDIEAIAVKKMGNFGNILC